VSNIQLLVYFFLFILIKQLHVTTCSNTPLMGDCIFEGHDSLEEEGTHLPTAAFVLCVQYQYFAPLRTRNFMDEQPTPIAFAM